MIRVTLELVSAVSPDRDRLLGVGYITNTGHAGEGRFQTYDVKLSKTIPGRTGENWKRGRAALKDEAGQFDEPVLAHVAGFDTVGRGAWDLLYLCLRGIVGSRNA